MARVKTVLRECSIAMMAAIKNVFRPVPKRRHGQRRHEHVYEVQGHDGNVMRSLFGRGRIGKVGCNHRGLTAAVVVVQRQRADGSDGRRQQQQHAGMVDLAVNAMVVVTFESGGRSMGSEC